MVPIQMYIYSVRARSHQCLQKQQYHPEKQPQIFKKINVGHYSIHTTYLEETRRANEDAGDYCIIDSESETEVKEMKKEKKR